MNVNFLNVAHFHICVYVNKLINCGIWGEENRRIIFEKVL